MFLDGKRQLWKNNHLHNYENLILSEVLRPFFLRNHNKCRTQQKGETFSPEVIKILWKGAGDRQGTICSKTS
jgi:hypothetical protein